MPISEEKIKGLETQSTNIRERLSKIEGRLDAPSKSPNAILIAVLSIVGVAVIWYWGWVGTQIVDQGKKLAAIEANLKVLGLQIQASLPQSAFDKALPDIRSTIAAARKDRISVPPTVIEGLRSKLLASDSASPDFWPTLSEFVSYRSALSYRAAAAPAPLTNVYSIAAKVPDCVDSAPQAMKIVSTTSFSKGLYENCRFVLDSAEQDQKLNAILQASTPIIVFKNCLIEYHGGEISLILAWNKQPLTFIIPGTGPQDPTKFQQVRLTGPAIDFQNCLINFAFQKTPSPNGQLLATALLAQDASSASLPIAM